MTDVKRLLEQATPLPWHIYAGAHPGIDGADNSTVLVYGEEDEDCGFFIPENAELVVHAVNSLPAYEEAVDALERFVTFHSGHVLPNELAVTMRFARAALSRLRGEK